MKDINNMNREELIEIIRIKNVYINELKREIELYQEIIKEMKNKS